MIQIGIDLEQVGVPKPYFMPRFFYHCNGSCPIKGEIIPEPYRFRPVFRPLDIPACLRISLLSWQRPHRRLHSLPSCTYPRGGPLQRSRPIRPLESLPEPGLSLTSPFQLQERPHFL